MRVLAIGDIHGCYRALRTLAEAVPFKDDDVLVTLGDCVDRGPNSREVIDWLIEWSKTHQVVCLRGNHEVIMMDAIKDRFALRPWLEVGGMATMESYQGGKSGIPQEHWEFLENTIPWWSTDTHIFVHASVNPALPMEKQTQADLYWKRVDFASPAHMSGKKVVCGHSAHKDGVPKSNGHLTCIDTWAYGGGWLTALDVSAGVYWQARESGEVRQGVLEGN
ncbi:MAG: serine/threonine protein phosphatase 1 [Verrucomicrobia bacterium]|jgi:serine/threonine protein phosphatase 1|nr:MAG: serine/threonine protein phosphatase 1 [Verrucomicrobiota bacterium]